jgi:hypothetical protein
MDLLFKRDCWIKPLNYNKTICYNPSAETLYFYKTGFFKHVIGIKNEHIILKEFLKYKNTFFRERKIKALFILPNKSYCKFMKIDLKNNNFFDDIEFSFKHKVEITLQNKKGNLIENEFYDLIFVKEDDTLEWIAKKDIKLNAQFKIYLHNAALSEKAYSHLLNQI